MEEETNKFSGILSWLKVHWMLIAGIAAAIVVVVIVLCSCIKTPKKVIKNYVSALNSHNAEKAVKSMDLKAINVLSYSFDTKFNEEDFFEFLEDYQDDDLAYEYNDNLEEFIENAKLELEEMFDYQEDNYKSYKIKIVKFKSVKKIEKGFYLVKVQVNVKATPASSDVKKIDKNTTTTFAVYNNKIAATTDIF